MSKLFFLNKRLLTNKNKSFVLALLLVVLLSQMDVANFLLNSFLGRVVFIGYILMITYNNKMMGLLSVIFCVALLNKNVFEGFEEEEEDEEAINKELIDEEPMDDELLDEDMEMPQEDVDMDKDIEEEASMAEAFTQMLGFGKSDKVELESNILKGKQSSCLPMIHNRSSGEVSPFDSEDNLNLIK